MIPRYSRPEMTSIWSEQSKFQIWYEIEAHACDAMADLGMIPKEAAKAVWDRGGFDIDRINEIERETKHDVIAFLTSLAEHVGEEARFVHGGNGCIGQFAQSGGFYLSITDVWNQGARVVVNFLNQCFK